MESFMFYKYKYESLLRLRPVPGLRDSLCTFYTSLHVTLAFYFLHSLRFSVLNGASSVPSAAAFSSSSRSPSSSEVVPKFDERFSVLPDQLVAEQNVPAEERRTSLIKNTSQNRRNQFSKYLNVQNTSARRPWSRCTSSAGSLSTARVYSLALFFTQEHKQEIDSFAFTLPLLPINHLIQRGQT